MESVSISSGLIDVSNTVMAIVFAGNALNLNSRMEDNSVAPPTGTLPCRSNFIIARHSVELHFQ